MNIDIVLRRQRAKKGKVPVYYRLYVPSKKDYSYKASGIYINPSEWDESTNRVRSSAHGAARINASIEQGRLAYQLAVMELASVDKPVTSDKAKRVFKGSGAQLLFPFIQSIIDKMILNGQHSSARRSTSEMKVLEGHLPASATLAAIDSDWLKAYELKRRETVTQNTVWNSMKFIRKVIREAYAQKLIKTDPFSDYKLPAYKSIPRQYLVLSEIDSLMKLIGSPKLNPSENATLCYFLLECLIGIRHSDWGKHTIERITDTDRIKLTAQKNKQPIYIAFNKSPRLKQVVEYITTNNITYNQPVQLANRHLKLIAQLAEIDKKLTTHVGRHTCATMLLEIGYSEEYVAEMLGISKAIVSTYAKVTRRKLQSEYDKFGGL